MLAAHKTSSGPTMPRPLAHLVTLEPHVPNPEGPKSYSLIKYKP